MRLRRTAPATSQLLLLTTLASHASFTAAQSLSSSSGSSIITLSQFQQISGFSTLCTTAYNAPIPGCDRSDFTPQDSPCSNSCIAGLRAISDALNEACKGVLADPTTLIGLLFEGRGVGSLCPNVNGGGGGTTSRTMSPTETKTNTPKPTTTTQPKPPPPSQRSEESTTSTTERPTTNAPPVSSTVPITTSATPTPTGGNNDDDNDNDNDNSDDSSSTTSATSTTLGTTIVTPPADAAAASSSTSATPPAETNSPETFGGGAIPFTVEEGATSGASGDKMSRMSVVLPAVIGLWGFVVTL